MNNDNYYLNSILEGVIRLSYLLEMHGITKQFNENVVLNKVDLRAHKGEVLALVGENGAGKSTLMKILAGVYVPDSGEIMLEGRTAVINSPKQAQDLGISMIFQEISLFPDLNVAENIFIRREPLKTKSVLGLVDWKKVYGETSKYLDYLGLNINPKASVRTLSIGQQKFVEIIKALCHKAKIIIMDEPTAALTNHEIELLFKVINDVKKLGVTILYISHRLEEIIRIADNVVILRDGEVVGSFSINEIDVDNIIKIMAGKKLEDRHPKLAVKIGKEVLRVENLGFQNRIRNVSFELRKSEIIGITGLSGSGRRTLAKTLFGINNNYEGQIYLNGKLFKSTSPVAAIKNGLCYVTGINTKEGLIYEMPISSNITLTNLKRVSRKNYIINQEEKQIAEDLTKRLEIKADTSDLVKNLSGGNQKKVILAKWLFANARILIIDEPTGGIDIGSKVDIYNIMNELVRSGASIIMISSDLSEIIGMCDRVIVMYNGEVRKEFRKGEATQESILYYASGGSDCKE